LQDLKLPTQKVEEFLKLSHSPTKDPKKSVGSAKMMDTTFTTYDGARFNRKAVNELTPCTDNIRREVDKVEINLPESDMIDFENK